MKRFARGTKYLISTSAHWSPQAITKGGPKVAQHFEDELFGADMCQAPKQRSVPNIIKIYDIFARLIIMFWSSRSSQLLTLSRGSPAAVGELRDNQNMVLDAQLCRKSFLYWAQISRILWIPRIQNPGSCRVLNVIFSFSRQILEILDPVTATLPWDTGDPGSRTAIILLDSGDSGSSLIRL